MLAPRTYQSTSARNGWCRSHYSMFLPRGFCLFISGVQPCWTLVQPRKRSLRWRRCAGTTGPIFLKFSGGRGISVGIGSIIAYGMPLFVCGQRYPVAFHADAVARFGGVLAFGYNLVARLGDMGWIRRVGGCVRGWIRGYHDCPSSYIRRIQRFVVNL